METLQQKLVKASAETEKWEGRRLLSAEKERNASFQIERIQADLENNEQTLVALQTKLKQSHESLAISKNEYDKVSAEIGDITQILKRSVKETENEIEELKSTYIDQLNEEATFRNELKHMEERLAGEKFSTEKISEQTMHFAIN